MNKPTRARTLHEYRLLEQRSCLGSIATVALVIMAFLHPSLTSLPTCTAAAGSRFAAAHLDTTQAAEGRDIADTPLPAPCERYACVSRASCDACHSKPGGTK